MTEVEVSVLVVAPVVAAFCLLVSFALAVGLAVGLAILAAAGAIVNYATGSSMNAGAADGKEILKNDLK